jgi:hypothetical protein
MLGGLQSRQFHADAGDAEDGGAVVADQLAREADQDRRQGREPRPLFYSIAFLVFAVPIYVTLIVFWIDRRLGRHHAPLHAIEDE